MIDKKLSIKEAQAKLNLTFDQLLDLVEDGKINIYVRAAKWCNNKVKSGLSTFLGYLKLDNSLSLSVLLNDFSVQEHDIYRLRKKEPFKLSVPTFTKNKQDNLKLAESAKKEIISRLHKHVRNLNNLRSG